MNPISLSLGEPLFVQIFELGRYLLELPGGAPAFPMVATGERVRRPSLEFQLPGGPLGTSGLSDSRLKLTPSSLTATPICWGSLL